MTPLLTADDIVQSFNIAVERKYWKARLGSAAKVPTVHFNSVSSMVQLVYYPENQRFAITFSKVSCAFGDFMASTYSALSQILTALKACGHEVAAPLDDLDGWLRIEFCAATKQAYVSLAKLDDDWLEYSEPTFKEPQIIL